MDDYAAQLNMARADAERRRAQEEEVKRVLPGGTARIVKKDIVVSLVGIILVALGIELVPFADLLPTWIGAVVAVGIRLKKAGRAINPVSFSFMGMLAGAADFADLLIVGSIPLVGDIFDGMMGMITGFWSWWQSHSS